jgi:hypothetical protein
MGELNERPCDRRVILDKVAIVASEPQEFPYFSNCSGSLPIFDFVDLGFFHVYFSGLDNDS